MQVIVDNLLTQYEQFGDGDVIVLLHGWADSSASWQPTARLLAKHYRVIVLNLPGFGGSQAPKSAWSLDEYAQFVGAFLSKLAVRPLVVIGHSNGGAIAIRGLAIKAFEADKLVLLASAGIRSAQKGKKRLLQLLAKTGKVITFPLPQAAKQKLRKRLYSSIGSDLLVAEHMQETFKRVVGQDVQADAAQLTLPTLLVYGESDDSTPIAYGQQLHQLITGSTLEILPGAGHFLQLDAHEHVVRLIQEFLQ